MVCKSRVMDWTISWVPEGSVYILFWDINLFSAAKLPERQCLYLDRGPTVGCGCSMEHNGRAYRGLWL